IGLDYLRDMGIEWSPHPSEEEVRREYERIWSQLGNGAIEDVVDRPVLSDPASLATLNVLTKLAVPAVALDANLHALVSCRAVNLSLERGNCDASCYAYVWLGAIAGARFGNYQAGYRFGRVGYELVEQRGWKRFQPLTHFVFGSLVIPWARPVKAGRDFLRRAFEGANSAGDVVYAAGIAPMVDANLLAAGDHLGDVERAAQRSLEFALKVRFGQPIEASAAQLGFVRTLRGIARRFGCLDNEQVEELAAERRFASNPSPQYSESWYWILKLQARFLAGDHAAAIEASSRAQRLSRALTFGFETADYHFYSALSRAACCDSASRAERQEHLDALALHQRQLDIWAQNCPENFENRALLVGAEIARVEGRVLDAERLYEAAIGSARENGFVQNEAVANELAARFHAARGFAEVAHRYLENARQGYLRWGADGKVRQLDQMATTARPLRSPSDVEAFMHEYYAAWGGTDEDRIMSYYADDVVIQIPGSLMQGQSAVREQFVRPFITGFPGNRHTVRNLVFGRDVVVSEFTFEAEHKGVFAGHAATDARIAL